MTIQLRLRCADVTMTLPSTSATLAQGLTESVAFSRAKEERIGMVVVHGIYSTIVVCEGADADFRYERNFRRNPPDMQYTGAKNDVLASKYVNIY